MLIYSTTANASVLSFLAKALGVYKQSFTQKHGDGLPEAVNVDQRALNYRKSFMEQEGIYAVEKHGATYYENNDKELALIKTGNKKEPAFLKILKDRDVISWKNGAAFIKKMEDYTAKNGCIPKITSASHGWKSVSALDRSLSKSEREFVGEGHGLSGWVGLNGIFATEATSPRGLAKNGARSLDKHLQQSIDKGTVKFCSKCLIQFYACNVSTLFVDTFAKISGCQVVAATGKASPYWSTQKQVETNDDKFNRSHAFHYWSNGGGVWEERKGDGEYFKSGWYRATPLKSYYGEVEDVVRENLGLTYIAL